MRSNCNKHVTLTHLNMCWVCRSCGVKRKSKQAVNANIMLVIVQNSFDNVI